MKKPLSGLHHAFYSGEDLSANQSRRPVEMDCTYASQIAQLLRPTPRKGYPRYAYGRRERRIVHLSDPSVGRGKEANLECPGCGWPFHKSSHRTTPHLKHARYNEKGDERPAAGCDATWRSGVHEVLVDLIAEYYRGSGWNAFTSRRDTLYDADKNPEFYADIVLESRVAPYTTVFIEVRVTHGMSDDKSMWLQTDFNMRNASVWTFDVGGSETLNYLRAAVFGPGLGRHDLAVLSNLPGVVVQVPTYRYEKFIEARNRRLADLSCREAERRRAAVDAFNLAHERDEAERRVQVDGWCESKYFDGWYRRFGSYTATVKKVGHLYQASFSGASVKLPPCTLRDAKLLAFAAAQGLPHGR